MKGIRNALVFLAGAAYASSWFLMPWGAPVDSGRWGMAIISILGTIGIFVAVCVWFIEHWKEMFKED